MPSTRVAVVRGCGPIMSNGPSLNPYAVMLGVPGDGFVRECCEEALERMRFLSDNMADPWADLNLFSAHGVDPLRVYTRAHPETGFRLPDEEEMDDWGCGRG